MKKFKDYDVLSKIIIILLIFDLLSIGLNVVKRYRRKVTQSTYKIVLKGDNPLIVYQEDNYVEPGYSAYNYRNQDKKSLVKVNGDIDTSTIGNYELTYVVSNFFKKNQVTRKIKVVENPLKDVDFKLKGDSIINLERNSKYKELGFSALSKNADFSKNVTINNKLDTSKVGTHEIIYTLKIGNKEKSIKRLVNVKGDKYGVNLSTNEITNKDVTINVDNYLKDFKFFINPNNVIVEEENLSFDVDKNGIYEFRILDLNDVVEVIRVQVSNIDKTPPVGICNSFISQNKTTYNIEANDENGVLKYTHNNVEYQNNSFVIDKIEDVGTVTVYDKALNKADIPCTVEYEYIAPKNNSYQYQYRSSTLKYWIENANQYYKTTHIWVKDAYNQMKLAVPNKKGSLQTAKTIINNEIKNKGYSKKGMVAINASGIVGGGFGEKYLNQKPSWVGTTAIPLVIVDGKIIRDSTSQVTPGVSYATYGLKKDGYLGYYKYGKGDDIEYNKGVAAKIIEDGIKNTFAFSPVLVVDKTVKATLTEKNTRLGLCQIDRNNFIIITNTNGTNNRSKGFSHKSLAEYMVKLNCKIGFNLDGGGSVNYYYKDNTSTLHSIKSSTRGLVDVLYFVEK